MLQSLGRDPHMTGGCNSRQTADILLHRLVEEVKDDITLWKFIKLLKRFIDDIFGLWAGTVRQFHQFVDQLNAASAPFGIKFGDFEIGHSVNFLDVTLYIDSEGIIQYKLYKKPTDSRLYLKTSSFHPPHVFDSVAYSQMLRVWKRNSTEETAKSDLEELVEDLMKCGHQQSTLDKLKEKMLRNQSTHERDNKPVVNDTITAIINYSAESKDLKALLKDLEPDIQKLSGSGTQILVACRKGQTIGSKTVKNGKLCLTENKNQLSQRCGSSNCKGCKLLCNTGEIFHVNGKDIAVPNRFNCKTRNALYIAQCKICHDKPEDNTYGGQTVQPFHKRVNGHRSCFVSDNIETIEKSALAEHCYYSAVIWKKEVCPLFIGHFILCYDR
jgi:hypothetical protein